MNQHIQSTDPIYTTVLTSQVASCTALGCNVWAPCSTCVRQTKADINAYELDMLDMLKKEMEMRPEGAFSMCSHENPCNICAKEIMDAEDIESLDEIFSQQDRAVENIFELIEKMKRSDEETSREVAAAIKEVRAYVDQMQKILVA